MLLVRLLLFLVPSSLWGEYESSWGPKCNLQHPAHSFLPDHMESASWGNQAVKTLLILGASFSRKLFWPHNSNPFPRALRVSTPGSLNSLRDRHLRNIGMATQPRPTPEAHSAWPAAGAQRPASSHSYACGQGRSPALWRLDTEVRWHASWRRLVSRLLGWVCVFPWAVIPANVTPGPGIRGGLLNVGKAQPKQVWECAKLAL